MLDFKNVYKKAIIQQDIDASYKQSLETLWNTGLKTLTSLYEDTTEDVIQACYDVSPRFCLHVVCVIYGVHWFLDAPRTIDKAYITCVALMLEGQWRQFAVLQQTFLHEAALEHLDGPAILAATAQYLHQHQLMNTESLTQAQHILGEHHHYPLDNKYLDICHLAVLTTLKKKLQDIPQISTLSLAEIKQLIFHLNTYLGCPRVWDASIQFN